MSIFCVGTHTQNNGGLSAQLEDMIPVKLETRQLELSLLTFPSCHSSIGQGLISLHVTDHQSHADTSGVIDDDVGRERFAHRHNVWG